MLAIDLGGSRVKAGLVEGGSVAELLTLDHGAARLDEALLRVHELIGKLAPDGCEQVAMCVPGVVDNGKVTVLPGKLDGAVGADLVGWLTKRTGGTATVVNDAIAYGAGECVGLQGRTVVVTIGTGIGTAVLENGRPLGDGPLGGGLLGGQLPLTDYGPRDTSGNVGTFEAWCRASRILDEVRATGCEAHDVPAAARAAVEGDAAALRGYAGYRAWLARGIAALCLAHAPDMVVVGGGPVRENGLLLDGLQEQVAALLWVGQSVQVVAARHVDAAALIGLSVLAA